MVFDRLAKVVRSGTGTRCSCALTSPLSPTNIDRTEAISFAYFRTITILESVAGDLTFVKQTVVSMESYKWIVDPKQDEPCLSSMQLAVEWFERHLRCSKS